MIPLPALLALVPFQTPQAPTQAPVPWLVSHQEADGRWDLVPKLNSQFPSACHDRGFWAIWSSLQHAGNIPFVKFPERISDGILREV